MSSHARNNGPESHPEQNAHLAAPIAGSLQRVSDIHTSVPERQYYTRNLRLKLRGRHHGWAHGQGERGVPAGHGGVATVLQGDATVSNA